MDVATWNNVMDLVLQMRESTRRYRCHKNALIQIANKAHEWGIVLPEGDVPAMARWQEIVRDARIALRKRNAVRLQELVDMVYTLPVVDLRLQLRGYMWEEIDILENGGEFVIHLDPEMCERVESTLRQRFVVNTRRELRARVVVVDVDLQRMNGVV
jgi:hypothetical protein